MWVFEIGDLGFDLRLWLNDLRFGDGMRSEINISINF